MLLKLASRNIRRSIRDYTIYFVTLLLGVALFYAFNSIGSQQIIFDLENTPTSETMFNTTMVIMGMFSVVIAFVLGFLVIYANQMLIRRRKHEFGIYLTLGMGPASISSIVLLETIFVGLAALALGLVFGLVLSQLLCFATAALFEIMITDYTFVFSFGAFVATILCFAVIFMVVALFNLVIVNRFKLINLLYANETNQKYAVRNPWVCFAAFVLSVVIIGVAYMKLQESGILDPDVGFYLATGLMLVGTLLLFWSLAGFIVGLLTSSKGVYLRGLVPFTVRQIASKINTAFLSLWAVCVLLFVALTTFSTGMSLVNIFTVSMEEATPYDISLRASMYTVSDDWDVQEYVRSNEEFEKAFPEVYARGVADDWNMAAAIEERMPEWESLVSDAVQIDLWYMPGVHYDDLIADTQAIIEEYSVTEDSMARNIMCVDRARYEEVRRLMGLAPSKAGSNDAILLNNTAIAEGISDIILEDNDAIEVSGHRYALSREIESVQLMDSAMPDTALTFVLPSSAIEPLVEAGMLPMTSYLNIDFKNGTADENDFKVALAHALPVEDGATYTENGVDVTDISFTSTPWPVTSAYTRVEMMDQARGFRMMITYLALYIGLVFLISIAAILAIQQLSVAIDSQRRYRMLWQLGCDSKMLSVSLLAQVVIYFLAPLIVAACHTVCAVGVIYEEMKSVIPGDFAAAVGVSIGLLVLIYGGYMLITFLLSRGMMRDALRAG